MFPSFPSCQQFFPPDFSGIVRALHFTSTLICLTGLIKRLISCVSGLLEAPIKSWKKIGDQVLVNLPKFWNVRAISGVST